MLDGVLGKQEKMQQAHMGNGTPQQHMMGQGGLDNALLQQLVVNQNQLIMNQSADAARAQAAERAKKSETKDPYTAYEVARLLGWANVERVEELPPLWTELLTSKDTDVQREIIEKRLSIWSAQTGIKIDPGFWLTKDQVKDIVDLKFSPGGKVGLLSNVESGISNLGALPRTFAEIEAIKRYEAMEEKARANMTMNDYSKKDNIKASRAPPTTYDAFQKNIGTTLGLIAITTGGRSSVYRKMFELHTVLQGGYVQAIEAVAFTPQKCRQYAWAVYEALREYYKTILTPDQFTQQQQFLNFPVINMDTLIEKIENGESVYRATYPVNWRMLDSKNNQKKEEEQLKVPF